MLDSSQVGSSERFMQLVAPIIRIMVFGYRVSQKLIKRSVRVRFSIWLALLLSVPGCVLAKDPSTESSRQFDRPEVADVVCLSDRRLVESSGLAVSTRRKGYYWTHNDSGDKACLYAFDSAGKHTARVTLKAIVANDWEDCCSFVQEGRSRLLIADCGDNSSSRSDIDLLFFDEPDPRQSAALKQVSRLTVRYPDGARNCEAVAVDPVRQQIVLITKSLFPRCNVYVVRLPSRSKGGVDATVTAEKVASLALPLVTAADIDQVTGDLWVTNYFQAFRFKATKRAMPLVQQLKQLPTAMDLPRWRQIEAVAVDGDQNIWVTSEGSPAPMGRLIVKEVAAPASIPTNQKIEP